MAAARRRPPALQRGVSLVEALVALAVMSFGMLAVVGVQATLRQNSDIAKQRSEAVRIGQEAIERWRSFSRIETDPAGVLAAYDDMPDAGTTSDAVTGYTTNTQYTLRRSVTTIGAQGHKSLRVEVEWLDRSGQAQSITLDTHVARADPSLTAGAVNRSSWTSPQARPLSRHVAIPIAAKDLGDGSSVFVPPAPAGAAAATAWVFSNLSGMITGVCTIAAGTTSSALSAADVAGCRDNTLAHLLSGYVRFATAAAQPTPADAEAPTGTALNLDISLIIADGRTPTCFDDAPTTSTSAATRTFVTYYCAIPANTTRSWAGYSTIVPRPFSDVGTSAWHIPATGLPAGTTVTHRLCRYTPARSDAQIVPNWQHPRLYRIEYADPDRRLQPLPMPPLTNQNFLVIRAAYTCPADVVPDPLLGDFVDSNTLQHDPLP